MSVVSRLDTFRTTIGGEPHSGWLPPGAAMPLPTPKRDVVLNFAIEFDGSGYLLIVESTDRSVCWDTWHQSIADAHAQAESCYGISPTLWNSTNAAAG